jgi:pimeloyl-ACP methyl ester carboxylesterase
VRALAERLKVGRFVLAGNSLGGQIAWATAAAMPDRVARLILVDASGYPMELLQARQDIPLGFRLAAMPWLQPLVCNTLPRRVVEESVRKVYGDPAKVTPQLVDVWCLARPHDGSRVTSLAAGSSCSRSSDTFRTKRIRSGRCRKSGNSLRIPCSRVCAMA